MKKITLFNMSKIKLLLAIGLLVSLMGCGGGGHSEGILSTALRGTDSVAPAPDSAVNQSITLTWNRPNANSDGSDLNDLVGYKIYYGPSSNNYTQSIDVGISTGAVISGLSAGSWCFATTAYDDAGNESDYSNEACTTIS
jgi:hypothetical protein